MTPAIRMGIKLAAELPAGRDVLKMYSPGGMLADYLFADGLGAVRAGRAQQLGQAAGRRKFDIPFSVRHPLLGLMGSGLAGATLGAGLGGLASRPGDTSGIGPLLGGLTGGLTGALGVAPAWRRHRMKQLIREYDQARLDGKVSPVVPQFSEEGTMYGIRRGAQRTGQLDAFEQLLTGKKQPGMSWRNFGYLAAPGPFSTVQQFQTPARAAQLAALQQKLRLDEMEQSGLPSLVAA